MKVRWWGTLVGASLLATPLYASGFGNIEQSARAAGLGGAVTAQVDDPSAIYYNPGALGLLRKKKAVAIGASASKPNQSLFQGLPPGIAGGTAAEEATKTTTLPHAFATLPFGGHLVAGVGYYTPLRAESEWLSPSTYAGRFLATQSRIESYDITPAVGLRITDGFGIGAGAIYRTSKISASRHLGATLGGQFRDIATMQLETDNAGAYGWTAGMLIRPSERFGLGLTYRSSIATDYEGAGRLTQISTGNSQFDQIVSASFPFNQDVQLASALEFPAEATVGVMFGTRAVRFEVDATQTQWSGVETVGFDFPSHPTLDTLYALRLDDTMTYRAGLRFQFPTGPQLRFGYAMVQSPQPDETVGAFLSDADRATVTAGFGLDWLDVAVGWTTYDDRTVVTNLEGLNGIYRSESWSLTLSVTK